MASRLLGTWFGSVPVETDPRYVRAMRLFGLGLWRGSAPFPVTGEQLFLNTRVRAGTSAQCCYTRHKYKHDHLTLTTRSLKSLSLKAALPSAPRRLSCALPYSHVPLHSSSSPSQQSSLDTLSRGRLFEPKSQHAFDHDDALLSEGWVGAAPPDQHLVPISDTGIPVQQHTARIQPHQTKGQGRTNAPAQPCRFRASPPC